MLMVTLPNTPENKEIFKVQSLFYISIKTEAYKTFGHPMSFLLRIQSFIEPLWTFSQVRKMWRPIPY